MNTTDKPGGFEMLPLNLEESNPVKKQLTSLVLN